MGALTNQPKSKTMLQVLGTRGSRKFTNSHPIGRTSPCHPYLMLNPFSEAFTIRVGWGEFEQDVNGMFSIIVGTDLFFFIFTWYRKIMDGRCSNIIIYIKQFISSFGSSMLGASSLRDVSKETSLGLSNFFLHGGIQTILIFTLGR